MLRKGRSHHVGALGRVRTGDRELSRDLLYPAELRALRRKTGPITKGCFPLSRGGSSPFFLLHTRARRLAALGLETLLIDAPPDKRVSHVSGCSSTAIVIVIQ